MCNKQQKREMGTKYMATEEEYIMISVAFLFDIE